MTLRDKTTVMLALIPTYLNNFQLSLWLHLIREPRIRCSSWLLSKSNYIGAGTRILFNMASKNVNILINPLPPPLHLILHQEVDPTKVQTSASGANVSWHCLVAAAGRGCRAWWRTFPLGSWLSPYYERRPSGLGSGESYACSPIPSCV